MVKSVRGEKLKVHINERAIYLACSGKAAN